MLAWMITSRKMTPKRGTLKVWLQKEMIKQYQLKLLLRLSQVTPICQCPGSPLVPDFLPPPDTQSVYLNEWGQ